MSEQPVVSSTAEIATSKLPATSFTLVGMGASAGGIQALQAFFESVPAETGMAFIVVMHLSPHHESHLAQVLQVHTSMPVLQIAQSTPILVNHVYVIPPNKHLAFRESYVELVEPQQASGKRLAVDLFFRTLAAAYGPRAVAVVLSGSDGDGSIGIKHIKEQGGITIAQEPAEAEYDSMPRAAISTGMVDWVLPVRRMAAQLLEFRTNEARMHVPPEGNLSEEDLQTEDRNSGGPLTIRTVESATDEEALLEVLHFVRAQTGHDFKYYKRATLLRRVARRLQVNLLETIPAYLDYLRVHPAEATALLHDLLISVTNFFRDSNAFIALENQIPQLFADKAAREQVRVWVAGCATGEEAYSVAMLLAEQAARLEAPPIFQVFATDLDESAIAVARSGVYSAAIEGDVSSERLRRFFRKEKGRYQVAKELRERVLFSVHNLLSDPPFSRLSLVTCRNLLIYLKPEAQAAVLDLFHFALQPGGLLLLGSAENISSGHPLFAPLDNSYRLFVRRTTPRAAWQLPGLTTVMPLDRRYSIPAILVPAPSAGNVDPSAVAPAERRLASFGDLHISLLEQFAPPSVVINTRYDIVHLSEHASRFLQIAGEPSLNLLQVVHPGLRTELRTALFRAAHQHISITTAPILVDMEGRPRLITLHVRPTPGTEVERFYLVVFELLHETDTRPVETPLLPDALNHHLENEIEHLRDQMRATVEQYEASVEELKAANEEHQSINEEMRSTAEELETSKEELQSTNEELTTVNQELKSHMEELSRANGDLQNLISSTEIGTIFLDRQLCIKRFTPRIRELFNLIPTDIGRPLSDITHKLSYQYFNIDAEHVLETLVRTEREVESSGRTFLVRLLPYRTLEDHIDGVVMTFIDITQRKQAEEALRKSEEKYRTLFDSMDEAYCILQMLYDRDGKAMDWRFLEVNPAFEKQNGLTNATGRTIRELAPGIEPKWVEIYERVAVSGESLRFEESSKTLERVFDCYAFRVGEPEERKVAVVFSNITRRKQQEQRQEFLLMLGDALRPLTEPHAIKIAAARVLGQYLKVNRVFYADADNGQWLVLRGHEKSIEPLPDRPFAMVDYGQWIIDDFLAGRALVVRDVRTEDRFQPAERAALEELQILGAAAVALVKNGNLVCMMTLHSAVPRDWNEQEMVLLQETAERTWAAVERARSEEALRASEAQLAIELADTQQLQRISSLLIEEGDINALYEQILNAARALMRSEMANIQTFLPERGELLLLAQQGYAPESAKFLERIGPDDKTSCGLTLALDEPTIVPDVELWDFVAGTEYLDHYRLCGIRAMLSTPLISRDGHLVGVISTHWREVHSPSERDLRLLDVLARQAADLIERRASEEALRESEEQFRRAIEEAPIPIIMHAEDGQVLQISHAWSELTGYTPEDMQSFQAWLNMAYGEGARSVRAHMQDLFRGKKRSFNIDFSIHTRSGEIRHWSFSASAPGMLGDGRRFIVGMAVDITERKKAEEMRLTLEQETTQLAERNRMAQELHDTLAQGFTAIKLQLDAAETELPAEPNAAQRHIVRARQISLESLNEARRSIQALRSPLLEGRSLTEALTDLAERASSTSQVRFAVEGIKRPLPPQIESDLYRICQEALTNALRHADSQTVRIELTYLAASVRLRVIDDGQGFDPKTQQAGFGRIGMEERAVRIGASLEINSAPGQGTEVKVTVALP